MKKYFKIIFFLILTLLPFSYVFGATEDCSNGIDDDGDSLIDCSDLEDCRSEEVCLSQWSEAINCNDGIDNDSDALIDNEDEDCAICGDGIQTGKEKCDDGNLTNGDGCDEVCTIGDSGVEVDREVVALSDLCIDNEDPDEYYYPSLWYLDADGDGYGNPNSQTLESCTSPGEDFVENSLDCDDLNSSAHPDSEEMCDGLDNNCDGKTDQALVYYDADGDGYGDKANENYPPIEMSCEDEHVESYTIFDGDCDDTTTEANPGHDEVCGDDIDNNCDGTIGEENQTTYYPDSDGDGYGNVSFDRIFCENEAIPSEFIKDKTDCDDSNAFIKPDEVETCDDGMDNNCDGVIDEDCSDINDSPLSDSIVSDSTTSEATISEYTVSNEETPTDTSSGISNETLESSSDTTEATSTSDTTETDNIIVEDDPISEEAPIIDSEEEILDESGVGAEEPEESEGSEAKEESPTSEATGGCGCDLSSNNSSSSFTIQLILMMGVLGPIMVLKRKRI